MRFGSVCSGIEAASVAWNPLGWKAAWLAEIEPFPAAVLAHHYPDVPNIGDMTKLPELIVSGSVEAPDLFCGGTPCQAFSVAGLRRSLADERGNLSLTFCEIADAIDDVRRNRGQAPTIVFWENVPGVLNTKDNAFGCFLGALSGSDSAIFPIGGRWTDAGVVAGPKRAVAWRTLDAQYFGLAQRRRRVFVVASAREGFDPAAVLLEWEGLRRDFAPSREAGEAVTGTIEASLGRSRGAGTPPAAIQPYTVANCLTQRMHKGINTTLDEGQTPVLAQPVAFDTTQLTSPSNYSNPQPGDPCHPLAAGAHPPAVAMRESGQGYWMQDDIAGTLRAEGEDRPSRPSHVIGMPIAFPSNLSGTQCASSENIAPAMGAKNPTAVALQDVRAMNKAQNGRGWNDDGTAYTVDTHATQGVAVAMQSIATHEVAGTMMSYAKSGGDSNRIDNAAAGYMALVPPAMQVRRLTPVECERLQGFPDNYTAIDWRNKPASECPDGPRYKALGNSWAVPVVNWIGRRIANATGAKPCTSHSMPSG